MNTTSEILNVLEEPLERLKECHHGNQQRKTSNMYFPIVHPTLDLEPCQVAEMFLSVHLRMVSFKITITSRITNTLKTIQTFSREPSASLIWCQNGCPLMRNRWTRVLIWTLLAPQHSKKLRKKRSCRNITPKLKIARRRYLQINSHRMKIFSKTVD